MCKHFVSREHARQRFSSWDRCAPGSSAAILALAVVCLSVLCKANSAGILDSPYNATWPWHLHVSYAVDTGNHTIVNAPQLSFSFALTALYLIGSDDLTWELYYKDNRSFYMSASNISSMWVLGILPCHVRWSRQEVGVSLATLFLCSLSSQVAQAGGMSYWFRSYGIDPIGWTNSQTGAQVHLTVTYLQLDDDTVRPCKLDAEHNLGIRFLRGCSIKHQSSSVR